MTTDSHDNKLYKQQIVQTIDCPYYRQSYLLLVVTPCVQRAWVCRILVVPILSTAAQPCKVGRDEYDRTDIENGNTTLKKKSPAVEILLSIRRTRPCQGRQAAIVPLHDKKQHQGLCISMAYEVYEEKCWGYPPVWPIIGKWLLSMSSTIVPVSSV